MPNTNWTSTGTEAHYVARALVNFIYLDVPWSGDWVKQFVYFVYYVLKSPNKGHKLT